MGAHLAHEALRDDAAHAAGDEVRLHADIDETVDGGRRVVGVHGGQHQVAGDGGAHGDLGRLAVANLAHRHDVGVLAQDGAQAAGEGHARFLVDLHLVHAVDVVFHRVFQRDEVHRIGVQLADHRVHGGAFARAGGAHDQHHAVVRADEPLVLLQVVALQADARRVEQRLALVQQADDHRLAVDGGQRVDAQVDVLLLQADVCAAVLRHAALRGVHTAHDLQTRDDRSLQLLRHREDRAQHAVDTHAHMQVDLARLQVDIAGALGGGSLDDAVHETHRGSRLRVGVVAQRGGLERSGRGVVGACRAGVALHLLDGAGGTLVAVQRHDGAHQRIMRGHHRDDALPSGVLHRFDGHEVQRVAHGQAHLVGRSAHGHHVVLACDVLADHAA